MTTRNITIPDRDVDLSFASMMDQGIATTDSPTFSEINSSNITTLRNDVNNLQGYAIGARIDVGDGSDGDVTITTTNAILGNTMFYNNLTIDAGAVLSSNNYRIFVKNTLTVNGTLKTCTTNGGSTANFIGGSAGTGSSAFDVGGSTIGTMGANGVNSGAGVQANVTGGVTPSCGGVGGNSGAGGSGSVLAGGASKAAGAIVFRRPGVVSERPMMATMLISGGSGGPGGSSGGGEVGGFYGGGGGGGGHGGSIMFISAKNIVIGATGNIQARGSNGGNGGIGSGGNTGGGGGGAAGGGGGVFMHYYNLSIESGGTIDANGGTGGIGGNGRGTGTAGNNGLDGASGNIFKYNMTTCLKE